MVPETPKKRRSVGPRAPRLQPKAMNNGSTHSLGGGSGENGLVDLAAGHPRRSMSTSVYLDEQSSKVNAQDG